MGSVSAGRGGEGAPSADEVLRELRSERRELKWERREGRGGERVDVADVGSGRLCIGSVNAGSCLRREH